MSSWDNNAKTCCSVLQGISVTPLSHYVLSDDHGHDGQWEH